MYFTVDVVDNDINLLNWVDVMPQKGLIIEFHSSSMRIREYERTQPV